MKKRILIVLAVLALLQGVTLQAQTHNPIGLQWDANTETDLAGYYIYEAHTSDGQVIGTYMVSVPAPLVSFDFPPDSHVDGQYYWKITAFDTAGNESGFSNEVTADFNITPPSPPTGCSVKF